MLCIWPVLTCACRRVAASTGFQRTMFMYYSKEYSSIRAPQLEDNEFYQKNNHRHQVVSVPWCHNVRLAAWRETCAHCRASARTGQTSACCQTVQCVTQIYLATRWKCVQTCQISRLLLHAAKIIDLKRCRVYNDDAFRIILLCILCS